jgi:hypothetical protein
MREGREVTPRTDAEVGRLADLPQSKENFNLGGQLARHAAADCAQNSVFRKLTS